MHAIVTDPVTGRFLGPSHSPADHFLRFSRNAGSWLLYGYGSFMVRERGRAELIGNCGVFHSFRGLGEDFDDLPEAGWILRSDRAGKGLACEAMTAALAWFERQHGRRRIVAMIAPGNRASIGLAAKLGFEPLRNAALPDGEAVRLFARPAAG
jgi:RimJ/RimL family protein N-acetyltransferase